ncbi:DoxX family protein [Bacillus haynesii]|uniref:DoxX family protein n=1 Tax=Bacillus sp. FSL K6-0972 TaxID=2921562 RepID=UPI001FD5F8C2|nr:DoxX family protein [Bacillus haynesii]MCY7965830.1 DoxX family protein [Bacillus haynesii]MCY8018995.1 DoxX family protein [Bacillus haynesii]MCY8092291.1 DoxX family protein [Bacillus haynesii]MCY8216141.1 DoxX family protein [Bacillus haynesii]MCY8265583.1 DoxX family protein [Bacillus haynesii]
MVAFIFIKAGLAAFMLIGGVIKVLHVPFQVEHWRHYEYPLWFLSVTGFLEIAGALGMIGGIWNVHLAVGSGLLFSLLMTGAIHAHLFRARQPFFTAIPAAVCLICALSIIIFELYF